MTNQENQNEGKKSSLSFWLPSLLELVPPSEPAGEWPPDNAGVEDEGARCETDEVVDERRSRNLAKRADEIS